MEELLSKHKIGGGVWARQMQQKVHGAGAPKLPHRVRDAEVFALLKRKVHEHISLSHGDDDVEAPVEGAGQSIYRICKKRLLRFGRFYENYNSMACSGGGSA